MEKIKIKYDVDTNGFKSAQKALKEFGQAISNINSSKVEIPIVVINKNETLWQHFIRIIKNI